MGVKRDYAVLAKAIIRFLAKQGWTVAAVGESQIRQPNNWPKFNYEFVVNFTGVHKEPVPKKPKKRRK